MITELQFQCQYFWFV